MAPKGDCCSVCKSWLLIEPGDEGYGACRRFPPNRQRGNEMWPGTLPTEWCGEFRDITGPDVGMPV